MDPPAHLRVILPEDANPMSWEVIDGLEELKLLSLEGMSTFKTCSDLAADLMTKVKQLDDYLAEEYRGTFS